MSASLPEDGAPLSDDDWKAHVKAEDAALDAKAKSGREEEEFLPPPSIESLIQLLAAQSMGALGVIPGPDGESESHPRIARHFIDLLGVLEEKTKGNLSSEEQRMLEDVLHDLRMGYVAVTRQG